MVYRKTNQFCQLILPVYFSIFLNILLLKNPEYAIWGDGWIDSTIKCLVVSINSFFFWACFPNNTKHTFFVLFDISCIIISVYFSVTKKLIFLDINQY